LADDEQKTGWFARLKAGLSRSSTGLRERIATVVTRRRLDAETLGQLEEALIAADLGVEASRAGQELGRDWVGKEVSDQEIRETLASLSRATCCPTPAPCRAGGQAPAGRAGLRGERHRQDDHDRQARQAGARGRADGVLAACDTFRAAASSSSRSGASATACRSSAARRGRTRPGWRSTRSSRRGRRAPTCC
jgi:fused signal recognition particle receptor